MTTRAKATPVSKLATRLLTERADPARAPQMAAYMKTTQPFLGVPAPARREVLREVKTQFKPQTRDEYERGVASLWALPHREEQYLAVDLAQAYPRFITPDSLPLYERMIREGAWWDFVDAIAAHLVGRVLLHHRAETNPILDRWIADDDLWVRRAAILAHLKHKSQTDEARLFNYCAARMHEKEFFMRKAIGWALREYAKTNPDAVIAFVKTHRAALSPLSVREATRHLPPT